jgi:hypothetical protein
MSSSTSDELINAKLEKLVPEIQASRYGKYPMCGKQWHNVTDTNPDGELCYIKGPYSGPKTDYVFGGGTHGELYYHLLTKPAYVILCNRITKEQPSGMCGCFSNKDVRQEISDYEEVIKILSGRAQCSIPDDKRAIMELLFQAQGQTSGERV